MAPALGDARAVGCALGGHRRFQAVAQPLSNNDRLGCGHLEVVRTASAGVRQWDADAPRNDGADEIFLLAVTPLYYPLLFSFKMV